MFKKILIANRGEIVCRVAATAARLAIKSVAVYSDADANAKHVAACDEAIHIGGSAPKDSYLRWERIIEAAKSTGAQAIHPGYGFLSENAAFASACHGAGRSMSRNQATKQWQGRAVVDELAARGILIRSPSLRGVAEEAPGAYKDVGAVVDVAAAAGLSKKVARLEPLICIKG